MCAAIYMAEVGLPTAFVEAISRCTIEPVREINGKEHMPDIETPVVTGLSLLPAPHRLLFAERIQTLAK